MTNTGACTVIKTLHGYTVTRNQNGPLGDAPDKETLKRLIGDEEFAKWQDQQCNMHLLCANAETWEQLEEEYGEMAKCFFITGCRPFGGVSVTVKDDKFYLFQTWNEEAAV